MQPSHYLVHVVATVASVALGDCSCTMDMDHLPQWL